MLIHATTWMSLEDIELGEMNEQILCDSTYRRYLEAASSYRQSRVEVTRPWEGGGWRDVA